MLGDLESRLHVHFTILANSRRTVGYPVYPIEHGLLSEELSAARTAAAIEHQTRGLLDNHWLIWVVLAAEAGYGYDGEEYWPSLEVVFGEWRLQQERQVLRRWFERFRNRFCGPAPVGRWADKFSIIAWPIAGALLPKYLQGHFARHLFQVRYGLSQQKTADAGELGTYLANSSDHRSARYDDFLQQADIVGRIVLALRDEDLNEPIPRIMPQTLARVVLDLEERQGAGEFLRAARQVLRSARGALATSLSRPSGAIAIAPTEAEAIKSTRLIARTCADGSMALGVRLPNFNLALQNADIKPNAIQKLKVRLQGETENWSPGAALFSWSNMDRRLLKFPEPGGSIIESKDGLPELVSLVAKYSRLEERPIWLLRQEADGVFRQVFGSHVRSGQEYLIITRMKISDDALRDLTTHRSRTNLPEVHALTLEVPTSISSSYRSSLKNLNLGFSLRLLIEPIGLGPIDNSSFNGPSWPTGEEVMFRLTSDFPVAQYTLTLDQGIPVPLAPAERSTFISIGNPDVGHHNLCVAASTSKNTPSEIPIDLSPVTVQFNVFEPRPWSDVVAERAGFRAIVVPSNATLESLLTGKAVVELFGPSGRRVSWRLETIDASGHVAGGGPLARVQLPMGAGGFAPALHKLNDYSASIDAAHRVDLIAELDELGRQVLRFSHQVEPLRWSLDPISNRVRLIDETAHEERVELSRIDLLAPTICKSCSVSLLAEGVDVEPPGALFNARFKGHDFTTFASVLAAGRVRAFSELSITQDYRVIESDLGEQVEHLLSVLKLWHRARPLGSMAAVRKASTVMGLKRELRRVVCGRQWADLLEGPPISLESLRRLQSGVGGSPGFGSRMRTTEWRLMSWTQIQEAFFHFADRFGITGDRQSADLAIALVFRPHLLQFEKGKVSEILTPLLTNRSLLRGAFLAEASVDRNILVLQT